MKRLIAGVLALTMTALLIGCGAKSEKNAEGDGLTVKILNNKESLCLAPVHIAIINGYFDEEFEAIGQKYEVVTSNIDTITEQITARLTRLEYTIPWHITLKRTTTLLRYLI